MEHRAWSIEKYSGQKAAGSRQRSEVGSQRTEGRKLLGTKNRAPGTVEIEDFRLEIADLKLWNADCGFEMDEDLDSLSVFPDT